MKNTGFALIAAAALAAAGCGFEHTSTPAAPTPAPDGGSTSNSGSSSGTLTGVWSSPTAAGVPAGTTCHEFQWRITSQTDTSLVGEFYANCSSNIVVRGVASGQLNGSDVTLQASGTGTLPGILSCPFTLNGTGRIQGNNESITIRYNGTTCFGPVTGEETLRRPAPAAPEPPPPAPPAPPPIQAEHPYHVGSGPLTAERAEDVVMATGAEYDYLRRPTATVGERLAAAEELLLRIIWHLQLAGFEAGRQKNPSGAISNDKLTIRLDGQWTAWDLFMAYDDHHLYMDLIFYPTAPPNHQPNGGIPD